MSSLEQPPNQLQGKPKIVEHSFLSSASLTADLDSIVDNNHIFYGESYFHHMLRVERRRTERSRIPFLMLLLDLSDFIIREHREQDLRIIQFGLASCLRETDFNGWYVKDRIIGLICTEMVRIDEETIERVYNKIRNKLIEHLDAESVNHIRISSYIYPEESQNRSSDSTFNAQLYPDLTKQNLKKELSSLVKKVIDVMVSFIALLFFSPVFALIAIIIKLTSKGPVFFKQKRLGINGKLFTLLKFRSMHHNCNYKNHEDYIKKYISAQNKSAVEPGIFKLNNDPRITAVGRFLRRTSLDELPQLINVLKGEMSLVGPRPPIPYEYDLYDLWHKRRLLLCKPGITGLWQVVGRSRTTFDEMVRLDLKYIKKWSLWLDIKILFETPKKMFTGEGAY